MKTITKQALLAATTKTVNEAITKTTRKQPKEKAMKTSTKKVATKKIGKRAAALTDPAAAKRIAAAREALVKVTKMGQKGEVSIVQAIRYIVGTFPLLRREALALLADEFGFQRGTVSTQFQSTRSGKVDVPELAL